MDYNSLIQAIRKKQSFLCVGLDTDIDKIPAHLKTSADPVFAFNKAIIDATAKYTVAYKPNTAFYECLGAEGWKSLQKTAEYIKRNYPGILLIADAKRGDIGNTSAMYAKAFFEHMPFDALTVAPYMGSDSVSPFLGFSGKWTVVLALTSNPGSADFQTLDCGGSKLFEKVLRRAQAWGSKENLMFVIGATRADMLAEVRKAAPGNFLLVPGIGAQGGSLEEVAACGMTKDCGLLVNSSRAIIYAGDGPSFDTAAGQEAKKLQAAMQAILKEMDILQG
jgi:orotidine-5'-phosphate decarboxylase